jgi:tripartite-type tricarboxylate transporter receptor subunit TctC
MIKRGFIVAQLILAVVAFNGTLAQAADAFPAKPIRIIVPAAPGGTTDIAARALADKMGGELGQTIVVDNRAGAAGIVGVQAFLAAPPDGHTILMGNIGPNAINYALYKSLSYKPEDMIPITTVISNPNVLVINPSVPARTVKELVALAKAHPGKISFASSGRGQSVHMSGELFKLKAGLDLVHVPYKGTGPALIAVLAGEAYMIFSSLPSTMGYIRSGRLRALGVTSKERTPELPNVPTMEQAGYRDFQVTGWFGLFASAKTPPAAVDRIYGAAKTVLSSPEIKARFAELGGNAGGEPPEQFRNFVMAEKQKWAQVATAAKIQPE